MEFKVGDKVKFIGVGCTPTIPSGVVNGGNLTLGAIYTTREVGNLRIRECKRSDCHLPSNIDIGINYQTITLVETNQIYCNAIFVLASRRVRRVQVKKVRNDCRLPYTQEWLRVIGK